MNPALSGPASGLAGDRGGDLAGAAASGAQRSELQAGQFAKRASVMRGMTDEEARDPRAWEREREWADGYFSRHRRFILDSSSFTEAVITPYPYHAKM